MMISKKNLTVTMRLACLATGAAIGMKQIRPPKLDTRSRRYPAYQKMMSNVARLASEPHPSGSQVIKTVRADLLTEIEEMGLEPIVEDASLELEEYTEVISSRFKTSREE